MNTIQNTLTGNEKFETVAEGKVYLEEIDTKIRACFQAVREAADRGDNETYRQLVDEHYDLKQVKKKIQNRMGNIVKAKMIAEGRL